MYFGVNEIRIDRKVSELDRFVLDFISIVQNFSKYVIINGYVAILLGRTRATEDVDIFISQMNKDKLKELYDTLLNKGYWCVNSDNFDELYEYLSSGIGIRFSQKGEIVPNMEVKFAIKTLQKEALLDTIKIKIYGEELIISSLERQIAFKRYYLKSDKDLEDARHIEKILGEKVNKEKIAYYKKKIENDA